MGTSPSIRVDDLTKTYGSITAIERLTIAIEGAQIVGLVGPNGAGKTTLIQCLLGLERPTTGTSHVDGTSSMDLKARDRQRIGYMPQEEAVYRDLTVRENVGFFARLYGVDDRGPAIDEALAFVGLQDREDARI
ncbi:MAG: ATP-binding cassette domain-containing protein, partial [Halobacteriaceae archaeon]